MVVRTAKKKSMNFIVQSIENMISIRNILNSFADDSCFNKNFFR